MRLFLDIDGVMADWLGSACKLLDIDPVLYKNRKVLKEEGGINKLVSKGQMWKTIDREGEDFWANLEPLPWAMDLYQLCVDVSDNNVCFLTSPSLNPSCSSGKIKWIQKHFKGNRDFLIGSSKHFTAGSSSLLIDDTTKKVSKYREHGGHALLFPNQYSLIDDELNIKDVYRRIEMKSEIVKLNWEWSLLEDGSLAAGLPDDGIIIEKANRIDEDGPHKIFKPRVILGNREFLLGHFTDVLSAQNMAMTQYLITTKKIEVNGK